MATTTTKLERVLGLWEAVMINVGCMVGTGIFITPRGVLAGVSSVGATLIIWVASGIITLLGALCYAEMGTMIAKSGGTYTYLREIFGDLVGFIFIWTEVMALRPALNAITALSFSYYCLRPLYPDLACSPPESSTKLLAVVCILFILFINCWSVRLSARVINATSIFKIIALSFIILSGLTFLCKGRNEHFARPFHATNIQGIGVALYSGLFSYAGWQNLNIVVEELKRPSRNLPLAICISTLLVTVVNTLVNIAYFTLLSPHELLNSDAVGFSYAANFLSSSLSWMMAASVALSVFGSLTAILFATSRIVFVGARTGQFPKGLAMISVRRKTPAPSLIFLVVLSICFCLVVDDIFVLINFLSFVRWVSCALVIVGLMYLRLTQPERPRPFKVNFLIPIIFLVACVFLTFMGVMAAPLDAVIGVGFLLSAVPVYLLMKIWSKTRRPDWIKSALRRSTILFQKLLYVVPEESNEIN